MAICTKEKVKQIYRITATTYDDAIDARIPEVAEMIAVYCNDAFISKNSHSYNSLQHGTDIGYVVSNSANLSATDTFTFNSSAKTITANAALFSDFQVGDDIVIEGSIRNSGWYTITVKTDTVITVAEDVRDEQDHSMIIYLVVYPSSVSAIAAKMIGWDVLPAGKKMLGLASETIGTWSGTKESIEIGGIAYPVSVAGGISLYKKGSTK